MGYPCLSFTKSELAAGFEKKNCDPLSRVLFLLQEDATKDLVEWIQIWEEVHDINIRELFRLPDSEFVTQAKNLFIPSTNFDWTQNWCSKRMR